MGAPIQGTNWVRKKGVWGENAVKVAVAANFWLQYK